MKPLPPGNENARHVVILGGGFAGLYAARHLEKFLRGDKSVRVTLVSRVNYFLMTPLLFEAGSGVLEPRHAVNPIRPLLGTTRFVQAEVRGIDLDRRVVEAYPAHNERLDLPYDHLVLALGGVVNRKVVPGSEHAQTFKTLADAIALRNHVIQAFERADVEPDAERKKALLTFAVVGGGLVGVELMGELTTFVAAVGRRYRHVKPDEIRFELVEHGPHLVPEFEAGMADYATKVLEERGVRVRVSTSVAGIEPGGLKLVTGETMRAHTIVLATGVVPSPLVASLPLEKTKHGAARVDATLRSVSRPDVWALGDCASIPNPEDPAGKPYPPLAQHALREAKQVAYNLAAVLRGGQPKPFIYHTKGTLAALGHFKGVGRLYQFQIYGFVAWWVWRSYYLFQMPQWSRRVRIVIDWTVALLFKNDVVQLDLTPAEEGEEVGSKR